jgi:hypothetical protein
MRKWLVLVLIGALPLLILAPPRGLAEGQVSGPRNEISVDLALPVVINLVQPTGYVIPIVLEYQRVLHDHLVLSIVPGVGYSGQADGWILLMGLWAGLNWHPFQAGLQGFYVGPGVVVFTIIDNTRRRDPVCRFLGVFLGLTIGYQFVLTPHMNVDVALGLSGGPSYDPYSHRTGLLGLPRAAVAIGYRF